MVENFFKNKKGLSTVVATLLIIVLVMVSTLIVWNSVTNIVKNRTEHTQKCFDVGISDKIKINEDYTCYNVSNGNVQISIGIGDIDVDELLISVSASGSSKSYTLTNELSNSSGLVGYPNEEINVKLPEKNAGQTYIAKGFTAQEIDSIRIAPTVGEEFCDVADTVTQIDDCDILA